MIHLDGRFCGALSMLDINARPFLGVATELRAIQLVCNNVPDKARVQTQSAS